MIDITSGVDTMVYQSDSMLFEAPNWTPDGTALVFNGDGRLFQFDVELQHLAEVDLENLDPINNDHVISPDGRYAFVSSDDGHIYRIDLEGSESRFRVSNDHGPNFRYYLHGISPDGKTLAYTGMTISGGELQTNVYLIPANGGPDTQITNDVYPDDGPEFSHDGEWLYFNSERGSDVPGAAQLFVMRPDGSELQQLTFDERVNWFPHPDPTGRRLSYVSFPPGTLGHPADTEVIVRLRENDGTVRDLATVFGGQGTMNVASWNPDGTQLAYVAYPIVNDTSEVLS
ncbi:TolB family protein [Populibacterium corticicola]|uniref:TolB family protein n=1 Tax=Populibacterium corticicola TaxID=1812826 RepID=UPI00366C92F8